MKNVFELESDFLAHYEKAREIARYSANWIRSCDGEDILGRAMVDADGKIVTREGHPVYEVLPRDGWVPSTAQFWEHVPFIAEYLQSTLMQKDAQGTPSVATRITPEIRQERVQDRVFPVRTLTIEITMAGAVRVDRAIAREFRDHSAPLLKLWYPLHEQVEFEWRALPPQTHHLIGAHTFATTTLLLRFRAAHEAIIRQEGQNG